jgi:hypothetical protein
MKNRAGETASELCRRMEVDVFRPSGVQTVTVTGKIEASETESERSGK